MKKRAGVFSSSNHNGLYIAMSNIYLTTATAPTLHALALFDLIPVYAKRIEAACGVRREAIQ